MSLSEEDVVDITVPGEDELERGYPGLARWLYENMLRIRLRLTGGTSVSDTFTTTDGKTVTVTNGIITDIT